jgi:alanine racemase
MIEGYQRVYAEVNLDAVCSNLEYMKDHIGPGTQICGVIKTDGCHCYTRRSFYSA